MATPVPEQSLLGSNFTQAQKIMVTLKTDIHFFDIHAKMLCARRYQLKHNGFSLGSAYYVCYKVELIEKNQHIDTSFKNHP